MKGIIYQVDSEDLKEALRDISEQAILGRFEDRLVGVNTVADIHGISRDTVLRRMNDGFIYPINEPGKHYKFPLSEVLKMNFKTMRKQLQFGKPKNYTD
ncbi:hypothetical protein ACUNWD_10015 [Sunxiuqinia sp. A32]|uniref:hypothetical protein n=1 Tax=Sunxiuqinia sp. A32 TaxID=3461496 RepID=UPI004045F7BC